MPETPEQRADVIRRAMLMLKNRGVNVEIGEEEFFIGFRGLFEISKFIVGGIGTAYFYLFILEESVQTAGFGVFTLMQGKLWREAYVQNLRYRELVQIGKVSVELLSFKQEKKLSENYIVGAVQILKLPIDLAENILGSLLGMKEGPMEMVFMPFKEFFEAAEATANSYDARIASEIHNINPDYKMKVDAEKKRFADDKFKLQTAHQERIDTIALEKKQRNDELAIEVKIELQKLAAQQRKKEITRAESDKAKILIEQEKDKIQVAIKQEFDERERGEKENARNALDIMARIHENRLADMREEAFHTGTPTGTISTLPITPPPESFTAKVIKVIDGDTFDIPNYRIRTVGINAAELGTEQGSKDADYAEILLAQKEVTLKVDPQMQFDKFGRVLAVVFVDGKNYQLEMLRSCHARLDLREQNKYVDVAQFEQAAKECLIGTQQPQPAPAPFPTAPQPQPVELVTLTIIAEKEDRTRVQGFDVKIRIGTESTGKLTDVNGIASFEMPKGSSVTVTLDGIGKWLILPGLAGSVAFQPGMQTDETHTIITREIAPQPAAPPPFAVDVDNLKGLAHSVEFGLLSPPETIGAVRSAINLGIVSRREFSLDEVRRTDAEILAVRLNIDGPFTNTEIMDFDYELVRPNGTSLIVPESTEEKLPVPSARGFEFWNWAKFSAVFNGIGGDLIGTGMYKLIIKADTGGVMSGTYELFFNVS